MFGNEIVYRRAGMKRLLLSAMLLASPLAAQRSQLGNPPKPKPAFPAQTDAPAPVKPSPKFNVETITTRLNGPWSLAFLPDGKFLVTEGAGTMRTSGRTASFPRR